MLRATALLLAYQSAAMAPPVQARAPSEPRQMIRLLSGGRVEQLPAAMVDRFPTWVLTGDEWVRVPDGE
eukprot:CAMPEP_0119291412 /NCGR_PEP_ID=MMETSP1329-20130426/42419_1 /TAXON_ID=114041 /ORGANISM="Genus nov. species nov., Strain RCC1024" /LENGTH=68 /DNA_ID=CAMNT_0007292237 /DNA_START=95 /DNA_END=298 /DNA_ORIENTATION=+